MKTLIVGTGALGGIMGARLLAVGASVSLATRSGTAAEEIKASGLRVTGIGGDLYTAAGEVTSLAEYSVPGTFDLIVLATKAQDAIDVAPSLVRLLAPGGTLLPIQNGGVPLTLASRLGKQYVLGGLSNLTGTMLRPGVYKQTNAGHVPIGELGGGESDRSERVRQWLCRAVNVKVTPNLQGAVWSKLLLNCSITTTGAIAGMTMRAYIDRPEGRELFGRTYDEALSVALASGVRPEKMRVDPIPPGWNGRSISGEAYNLWLGEILNGYGDAKASMQQDFERGRATEIDFINGYVVDTARRFSINTPVNIAIIETVHAITRGQSAPDPNHLAQILENSADTGEASVAFPLSNKGKNNDLQARRQNRRNHRWDRRDWAGYRKTVRQRRCLCLHHGPPPAG